MFTDVSRHFGKLLAKKAIGDMKRGMVSRNPLKSFGWGRGGRTPIHGVRVRCPSIERSPSCGPSDPWATPTFYQTGRDKSNLFRFFEVIASHFCFLTFAAIASIFLSGSKRSPKRGWTPWDGRRLLPEMKNKPSRSYASSSLFLPARDGSTGGSPYGPEVSLTSFFATKRSSSRTG